MIDLLLTESGDIDIETVNRNNKLNISFYVAKYQPQRISFICMPEVPIINTKHQQNINFMIVDTESDDYKSRIVEDIDEIMQAIRMRLKTEYGDVPLSELGSDLWTTRHSIISGKNDSNISIIKGIIEKVVSSVVNGDESFTVDVRFEPSDKFGYFKEHTVKANIDYKGTTLISFTLWLYKKRAICDIV